MGTSAMGMSKPDNVRTSPVSAPAATPQACFISRLPTELLQRIIRENYYMPQTCHHSLDAFWRRRGWLARAVSVSRYWCFDVVYPVLYAEVILHTFRSLRLFHSAITQAPDLARYVRWLAFSTIEDERPRDLKIIPSLLAIARGRPLEHPDSMAGLDELIPAVVQQCPNLHKYSLRSEHLHAMRDMPGQWSDNVDSLFIAYIHGELYFPRAPNLRRLTLGWPHSAGVFEFKSGYSSAYPRLGFLSFSYLTTTSASMLGLLSNLRPTLQSLGCSCVTVVDGDVSSHEVALPGKWLLPLFGSESLRALRLSHWEPSLAGIGTYTLTSLTGLTDLALNANYARDPVPPDFYPPQLERIRFITEGDNQARPLTYARHAWRVIMLDRCRLPKLKSVVLQVMATCDAHTYQWTLCAFLLQNAARERGLELVVDLDIGYYWPESAPSPSPSPRSTVVRARDRIVEVFRATTQRSHQTA